MKKVRTLIFVTIVVAALVAPTLVGAQSGDTLPGSGWWTGQQIQNIGTGDATIVSTAYAYDSSQTYMASAGPIAPGAAANFLPADFTGMPNGFQGSAVVASDQPIKAMVTVTNRPVGSYGVSGGVAGAQYQGIDGSAASTTIAFPQAKKAFGPKTSTLFVQNAGSAPDDVLATFTCPDGAHTYTTAQIQPGQMAVVNLSAATPAIPDGSLCSATMTSGQPLAGVYTEHWTTETVATLLQSTKAFTQGDYDTTIYAPVYKKAFPADPTRSRTTGVAVQNVTGGPINVTATFYYSGGTCTPVGHTITWTKNNLQPNELFVFLQPTIANGASEDMPDGCLASAVFVGTGNIAGLANDSFLNPIPPQGTQSSTTYSTFADHLKTNEIAVPLFKEKFGNKSTGVDVQNIGAGTASIWLEFKTSTGTTYTTVPRNVAAGTATNYFLVSDQAIWQGTPMPTTGANYAVTVHSDQPVVALVSETPYYPGSGICFGQAGNPCFDRQNYEGFNVTP